MNQRGILVVKRDGSKEPLDIEKLHRVVFWATENLTGVSASEVEIRSQIQFYNGIKTTDLQETLIKAAADLISEEAPNYQYVAGRLVNYHLLVLQLMKTLNFHNRIIMNQLLLPLVLYQLILHVTFS